MSQPSAAVSQADSGSIADDFLINPWSLIQDSREQFPWNFRGIKSSSRSSKEKDRPLIVPVKVAALQSGDYSIEGMEQRISCERKSLSDSWSTFGGGRERFERELERLSEMEFAVVIVEASLESCLRNPPQRERDGSGGDVSRKFTAKSFFRSVLAWQMDYPVRWIFADSRWYAEQCCFRLLDRFFRKDQERLHREKLGIG